MRRKATKRRTNGRVPAGSFDSSALDLMVGHLVRVVQVRLFQRYYEGLGHLEVSPGAFAILVAVRTNPGVQHSTLAEALAAHGPNITKLVDKLVRAGWVERRKLPGDRRATGHYLTARGQAKADAVLKAGIAHDSRATSALSARERAKLLGLLAKLERSLTTATRPA